MLLKSIPLVPFHSLHALLRISHMIQMCGSHYIFFPQQVLTWASLGMVSETDP